MTYGNVDARQKATDGWTLNGVKYDTHVGTVTLTASGTTTGQFDIEVSATSTDFANVYTPDPGYLRRWRGRPSADISTLRTLRAPISFRRAPSPLTCASRPTTPAHARGDGVTTVEQPIEEGSSTTLTAAQVSNGPVDSQSNSATYDFGEITFDADDMVGAAPLRGWGHAHQDVQVQLV